MCEGQSRIRLTISIQGNEISRMQYLHGESLFRSVIVTFNTYAPKSTVLQDSLKCRHIVVMNYGRTPDLGCINID